MVSIISRAIYRFSDSGVGGKILLKIKSKIYCLNSFNKAINASFVYNF
jgi:hypothetical protein